MIISVISGDFGQSLHSNYPITKINKLIDRLKKDKLECAVHGVLSQIPTLKFLTPPSPTRGHEPGNRMKILFNIFFYPTHTKFGIKSLKLIYMLMIFDLLNAPQGHQFDPRMKMILAFCSACHPSRFDMPHDHV